MSDSEVPEWAKNLAALVEKNNDDLRKFTTDLQTSISFDFARLEEKFNKISDEHSREILQLQHRNEHVEEELQKINARLQKAEEHAQTTSFQLRRDLDRQLDDSLRSTIAFFNLPREPAEKSWDDTKAVLAQ